MSLRALCRPVGTDTSVTLPDLNEPRQIGDHVLHQQAKRVENDWLQLDELVERMERAMRTHHGIGIAAPQIGVSRRVFLAVLHGALIIAVNPELEVLDEQFEYEVEGCLSVRGKSYLVPRSRAVRLSAYDLEGTPFSMQLVGYPARIVQHEMDHLQGLLIPDRGQLLA